MTIIHALHYELYGGYFIAKHIIKKKNVGYYWLTIFKDTTKFIGSYDSYQRMGKSTR